MATGVVAYRSVVIRMRRGAAIGLGLSVMVLPRRLIDRSCRVRLRSRGLRRWSVGNEFRLVGRRRVQPTHQHHRDQSDKKDKPSGREALMPRLQHTDGLAHSDRTVPTPQSR